MGNVLVLAATPWADTYDRMADREKSSAVR